MEFLITWLPTVLVFILMLGLLIFVHELGHFVAARLSGMKVEEFAFGFPPTLWSKKKGGTKYMINLFPIGGYVKILGEDETSSDKQAFGNRPIRYRVFVIVAGVLMNFVLAFVVIMIMFWCSYPPVYSDARVYGGQTVANSGALVVDAIEKGSLAEEFGIQPGDSIIQIDNINAPRVADLRSEVATSQGGKINLTLKRGNDTLVKEIEIRSNTYIGVELQEKLGRVHYTWWKVPYYALIETAKVLWATLIAIIVFLKNLIVVHKVPDGVMGPVGIFGITSVMIKLGLAYVLNLIVALTINLGIINILPFPALDGGRLIFLIAEKVRGKKVAQNIENIIHGIGFFILIALVILVTIRDILRL